MESLRELGEDMRSGRVETVVIIGGNPVFTAPADLQFTDGLQKVGLRIHLGLYDNETAQLCHWHISQTHYLESWSDARAFDGTASIIQPLIAPLYAGRSEHELLSVFLGQPDRTAHDIVHDFWRSQRPGANFEPTWETWLNDGLIGGTALPPKQFSLKSPPGVNHSGTNARDASASNSQSSLEIVFRPDPTIWDGRFANNGLLQELPKPFTKITWDNAALLSPRTAQRLSVNNEEIVTLVHEGRQVRAPVWIMPGHADDSVTVHLGYGRERAGQVGTGLGFNACS